MSAFICTETHIGAIVRFYITQDQHHSEESRWDNAEALFAILADENARSVNTRYALRNEPEPAVTMTRPVQAYPALDPVSALKQIACLDYQSCETDDWTRTRAYRLLERIKALAIYRLPGYAQAPWGLGEEAA